MKITTRSSFHLTWYKDPVYTKNRLFPQKRIQSQFFWLLMLVFLLTDSQSLCFEYLYKASYYIKPFGLGNMGIRRERKQKLLVNTYIIYKHININMRKKLWPSSFTQWSHDHCWHTAFLSSTTHSFYPKQALQLLMVWWEDSNIRSSRVWVIRDPASIGLL